MLERRLWVGQPNVGSALIADAALRCGELPVRAKTDNRGCAVKTSRLKAALNSLMGITPRAATVSKRRATATLR
jgi:hypothetical protein